jgi:hypothetical protein
MRVRRFTLFKVAFMHSWMIVAACGYVAEKTAPEKHASTTRTPASLAADELFWATLHGGAYKRIPEALEAQTGAYLMDPRDAVSAAHVGWLHIWRLSERARLSSIPATLTDDASLSRRYFQEAVALNPTDARYLGFLASATLAEGSIHQDERLTRRGYFLMKDAIEAWPEFNLFTAGYTMSTQPADSKLFRQALQWQWQNLEACTGEAVDRKSADYARYMALETREGRKRVCWNSTIAPHNFEGFFLNMGDMLVKAGDWQTARKIYANARLSRTYSEWPYREVLEDRIREAPENVAAFNAPEAPDAHGRGDKQIMVSTAFACMACHRQ